MKLLTLALILLPFTLVAQNSLSGRISNTSEEPEFYCKLLLIKDSVVLQTVATDSVGNYLFEVPSPGEYKLTIKVPFKSIDTLITINGQTKFDLKVDDGKYLDAIEIVGKKPTVIRKVDRIIFNPANIPELVGGNATDVIEFAPGVFINGDNIQLSNGTTARVMLNDKLIPLTGSQLISFIKSIPTEDIQYIEILPVATVKYAASSGGGLINIQLVIGSKSKLSKGSVTADVGQKFYSQQQLSASYAFRKNKFSLYSNLSLNNNKTHPIGEKTIEYDTVLWSESYSTINRYKGINGAVGVNYEFSPKTELGILYFTNYFEYENNNTSFIDNTTRNDNTLLSTINNGTKDLSISKKNAVNVNLVTRLDSTGRKIDFNFDYTNFRNDGNINYTTRSQSSQIDSSSSETNKLIRTGNLFSSGIDYVHPIKDVTLSLGGRYSYTANKYDLSVYNNLLNPGEQDTLKSNGFNYDEHIQAVYASVDWKVKRWSFQVGLRGENTMIFGESTTTGFELKNNYFQIVPKLFLMYETKKARFWNLSYSRDFYRPTYNYLNPFRYYTSSYSYTDGNPKLKPSIYHSLSLSTDVGDVRFSLSFDYSAKGATSITIFNEATQVQQTTMANVFSSMGVTLFTNYYKSINKRFSIDFNLITSFTNTKVVDVISPQNLNLFNAFTSLSINYSLDKKKSLILRGNCSYGTPSYQQITRNTEFPYMTFSLTKNMLRDRFTLRVSLNDPFRLVKLKSVTRSNETVVRDNNYFDTQSIFLSASFKFGNNRMDVNQRRTNSSGQADRIGK